MFARTERLLLRPGWAEDAPALAQAMADEMVIRDIANATAPFTEADAASWLATWSDQRASRFLMVQRTASSPRLIGAIGLDSDDRAPCHNGSIAELSFWIARPFWGLGFATEAGRHMVELARTLGHRQIRAAHARNNPASGAVLRKLGFRAAGQHARHGGSALARIRYVRDLDCGQQAESPAVSGAMRCCGKWPTEKRDGWRMHAA